MMLAGRMDCLFSLVISHFHWTEEEKSPNWMINILQTNYSPLINLFAEGFPSIWMKKDSWWEKKHSSCWLLSLLLCTVSPCLLFLYRKSLRAKNYVLPTGDIFELWQIRPQRKWVGMTQLHSYKLNWKSVTKCSKPRPTEILKKK